MNYKAELEKLHKEYEDYKEKFEKQNQKVLDEIAVYAKKYGDETATVNATRDSLFDEINKLNKFLSGFGKIAEHITPFDLILEQSAAVSEKGNVLYSMVKDNYNEPEKVGLVKSISGTAGAATMGFLLGGAPGALVFGSGKVISEAILSRKHNKQAYEKLERQIQDEKSKNGNMLKANKEYRDFCKTAVTIAEIYRGTIRTVKTQIDETILPEINGIQAFLYADAIKNCIINKEDPNNAQVASIAEYEDTAFDHHYVFIKNALDYYSLIRKLFTEPILTNIVRDGKVTPQEERKFYNNITEIEKYANRLSENSVFGGQRK